ncbi:hypothetical protein PsYK624_161630 [Phanerochaete sordida]|uniref:Uncharacterized protein n=1 Tax=Phanerochaete sordida TaxID=48140 RepID=A0A9P3GVC5_9APHY|nr:hypothetical protein PsYK624_161630 [Phanerochaete sordida]
MATNIQLYIGPYLVLLCVALMLFGVTCFQVYSYWVKYTRDHPRIRLFVLLLWLLECLHTIMCVHMLYDSFIDEFGDLAAIERIIWSAGAMIFIEACISSLSRGFSVVYIWQLSNGNPLLTAPPAILLICSLGFTLAAASLLYARTTWADLHTHRGTYVRRPPLSSLALPR